MNTAATPPPLRPTIAPVAVKTGRAGSRGGGQFPDRQSGQDDQQTGNQDMSGGHVHCLGPKTEPKNGFTQRRDDATIKTMNKLILLKDFLISADLPLTLLHEGEGGRRPDEGAAEHINSTSPPHPDPLPHGEGIV